MDHLAVTPDELRTHGAGIGQVATGLHPEFATVVHAVEHLLGSGWTGGAATGFSHGWTDWRHGAKEAMDALAELSRLLGHGAGRYDGTEGAASAVQADGTQV